MTTKRKHRRKGRYKRGVFVSSKSTRECHYRSGWELLYMQFLDTDSSVLTFQYEEVEIPYVSNVRLGRKRNYWPDLLITYTDGSKKLVEIKPKRKLTQAIVKKKVAAAKEWCCKQSIEFIVVTEDELKMLGLLK